MQRDVVKDLRFHIKVRVYGHAIDTSTSHGYLVDDTPAGISAVIGELFIDIRTVNLKQVRPMIQYNRTGHMDKRSLMFQEALFIMSRLPNVFSRPNEDRYRYLFGFVDVESKLTKFISAEHETVPIVDIVGNVDGFGHDLAIVPLSQLPVDFSDFSATIFDLCRQSDLLPITTTATASSRAET